MRARGAAAVLCAVLAANAAAQSAAVDPLDEAARIPRLAVGPVLLVGEDHPAPDLGDFPATVEGSSATARWIPDSVRWVRAPDGLPLPRARLRIAVAVAPERALLRWRGRAVLFQEDSSGAAFAEIFVPLLEGGEASVELDGRPAARVRIAAKPTPAGSPAVRHAIDHSCSPYRIVLRGLDDAYVSVNCRMIPVGRVGAEEALLEVRWAAAGVTLPDGSSATMTASLRDGRPARTAVIGPDGTRRVVELSAALSPRIHRLKLAWGAGPYRLTTSAASGNGVAGSGMLYGNFSLRTEDGLSVRFFEAAVAQSPAHGAIFNNLGAYFAYDLSHVWDDRLRLTALLGMQGVTYAPQGFSRSSYSTAIAPQGFEVSYFDAFGWRNRTLSGGMFLPTDTTKPYENVWLRYGARWFVELNAISWRAHDRYAKMAGLSIGAPFAQLF